MRYVLHYRRFHPYGKGLIGLGHARPLTRIRSWAAAHLEPTSCLL
jgi:hypothetical protein